MVAEENFTMRCCTISISSNIVHDFFEPDEVFVYLLAGLKHMVVLVLAFANFVRFGWILPGFRWPALYA